VTFTLQHEWFYHEKMSRLKSTSLFLFTRSLIPAAAAVLITATMLPFTALAQQTIAIIPHPQIGSGDLRTEVTASAKRLVGLSESFNPNSFIAHILYVNGLMSKDMLPLNSWARSLSRKLDRRGVLTSKNSPKPGDLVFFSLSADAPHSSKASEQTVAVVEKVRGDLVTFIYAGSSKVTRGTLALSEKKATQTKFLQCTEKVTVKDTSSKKSGSKSGKKKGKSGSKDKKKGKGQKTTTRSLPCTARDLLIGFADIEVAALTLNHIPPASDLNRVSGTSTETDDACESDEAGDPDTDAPPTGTPPTDAPEKDNPEIEPVLDTGTGTPVEPMDNKLDRILKDDGAD
jgi:hypothetical protein